MLDTTSLRDEVPIYSSYTTPSQDTSRSIQMNVSDFRTSSRGRSLPVVLKDPWKANCIVLSISMAGASPQPHHKICIDDRSYRPLYCRDGLGDISTRHPEITTGSGAQYLQVTEKPGDELALDLIRAHPPRAVTYIALGPLTNLALMARKDLRTCSERLGRVVSMGGALDVPGNTSPVAECMRRFSSLPNYIRTLVLT